MTQRVALVTGAMGGLGTAICQELAKAGHKVVASYHPQFDNKDAWLQEMAEAGFKDFVCVAGDVSSLEDCEKMVTEAEAAAGPVDILINNAGITRDKMFAKMEKDGWDAVISTNLTSLFNMTKQVSAKMAARGWGRIINISSVNGVKGQAGQTNYSAAKAGVIGFSKALAAELAAKGVTVNVICPGYVATKWLWRSNRKFCNHHRYRANEASCQAGRNRWRLCLSGLRYRWIHDRCNDEYQRRVVLPVTLNGWLSMRSCKTHETLKSPVNQGFFIVCKLPYEAVQSIHCVYLSE
jgi:acetoacetyl-CoA reductase